MKRWSVREFFIKKVVNWCKYVKGEQYEIRKNSNKSSELGTNLYDNDNNDKCACYGG